MSSKFRLFSPAVDYCNTGPLAFGAEIADKSEAKGHHDNGKNRVKPLSAEGVDDDFHEPGILSGYRPPNHCYRLCMLSLFQLHNETINIWTQIIPALYFFMQLIWMLPSGDPFLLIYLATTFLFLLTSACAHTFSCFSSCARHVCFFFDYAGITLYSCGCAVGYYAYTLPSELMTPSSYIGADLCDVYLFLSVFLCIWTTHLSGATRFWRPTFGRKVVRLGAFVIIWLYLAIPVLWRISRCAYPGQDAGECRSTYYWTLQFLSAVSAGILYVSHFPERWFPGKFDIFGHSHQIFHIFGASGAFNQYRALLVDYTERKQSLRLLGHSPSVALCVLCIVIVIFANLIIFSHFYKKLIHIYRRKQP
ncbi:Membrane progestin receptor gamma [Clonorchis sinensis]|uniref:Membrane progestin receptor gamma n=2 Tax=Clonorchis sinensis TaxID=79923 RepID=A0A8T1MIL3_CLOSI|nr:Membrane progestin receptor gamma [Clonorchis sinensis]GAA47329.1 membrane progestin receptor gamma [Clonorchis sinensis]